MKVLLIDVNCKSSSTGQIVYNLYSYLNGCGHDAAVCYGRGELIKEKNIYKFGLDWETYLHALLTRITGYTGCFSFFSTRRLIRFIEQYNPDIVHIHELHAYFVNIKPLLSYLANRNIRVVHTLHCEFSYTGKCGHSVECEKWKTECGKCPHLKDYPATICFDHTKRMHQIKKHAFQSLKIATYVAPSQWLFNRMKDSFLCHCDIRLIHNSIDTNVFFPRTNAQFRKKNNIDDDTKVVLAVAPGLLSDENKGGKFVLELADRMNDYLFILIGADEAPYEKGNVRSLGKIYDKEILADYYTTADVFLICSRNENFPTTCIEAVCCGTPVVGFDVGGAKEVATGDLGTFVRYGDLNLLEDAVKSVIENGCDRLNDQFCMSQKHFSVDRMCNDYMSLYKELCSRNVV